jgi:hypothetical protein
MKTRTLLVPALTLMAVATGFWFDAATVNTVPAFVVNRLEANPGETDEAFIQRTAGEIRTWTETTATEACGRFGRKSDGTLAIVITTQKAQTVCIISSTVPEGQKDSGESIHSHPGTGGGDVHLTDQDRKVFRALGEDDLAHARVVGGEPSGFSRDDIAGGPGYLVFNGHLLHQKGAGTSVDLGTF